MNLDIVNKFQANLDEIDAIFNTSTALRDVYLQGLRTVQAETEGDFWKKQIGNSIKALEQIADTSISKVEQKHWNRLYAQALLLVISISEQLLKEVFNRLLASNLEKIKMLDRRQISLKILREKNFELSRNDWIELLSDQLFSDYEEENPGSKVNLQNIQSIKSHFKSYFELEPRIDDSLQKQLHYFYQLRHIIVHNAGKIDRKFIDNLNKIDVKVPLKIGDRFEIKRKDYQDCKNCFLNLFAILEDEIAEKKLAFD
ncbi:MAG TPA: hypothetical protein VHA78_01720 [Candidatus Peribacteraceae bacterium]|nr:hypothetical protein [Candidatus Peribacteraceae bacterium]